MGLHVALEASNVVYRFGFDGGVGAASKTKLGILGVAISSGRIKPIDLNLALGAWSRVGVGADEHLLVMVGVGIDVSWAFLSSN